MREYYFEEINSTQDYAKKVYAKSKTGFVIFADKQTLGRGRNGRVWESPVGGLWFSFDMEFGDIGELFTPAVGVATREVLQEVYKCKPELKWPNDLVLDGKKVGGIICEKINDGVIVGIGINTNTEKIEEEKAGTFFEKTGITVDNHEVMNRIIKRCKETVKLKADIIVKKFRENMAYRGKVCFVSVINEDAKILDIADNGHLIIETNSGIKEVSAGEINICI